jgi:hypothetical protein
MEQVPHEIFHQITAFLDLVSLFLARGVCKSWRKEIPNDAVMEVMIRRYNIDPYILWTVSQQIVSSLGDSVTNSTRYYWNYLSTKVKEEWLIYNTLTDSNLPLSIVILYSLPIYNNNPPEYFNQPKTMYSLLCNQDEEQLTAARIFLGFIPSEQMAPFPSLEHRINEKWIYRTWEIVQSLCYDRIKEDNFFSIVSGTGLYRDTIVSIYTPAENKWVLLYYLHEGMKARGYGHITLDPLLKREIDRGRKLNEESNKYKERFTLKEPLPDTLLSAMQTHNNQVRECWFTNIDVTALPDRTMVSVGDSAFELGYHLEWLIGNYIDVFKSPKLLVDRESVNIRVNNHDITVSDYGYGAFSNPVEVNQMIAAVAKLQSMIEDVENRYFKNIINTQ